ncbi:MAG: hypothetical protein ACFFBT_07600 [Promethearchaeota archaeon]
MTLKKKVGETPINKHNSFSKKKFIITIILLAFGVALMPTGFLLHNFIQTEIEKGIAEEIRIPGPNDPGYNEWISNDYPDAIPEYRKFYMWNLSNPAQFLTGNRPILEEIGPYVFREYTTKYEVSYSAKLDEVTYKQYSTYRFQPDMSAPLCSLDDNIININPAYLGVLELAENEENLIKVMFPSVLSEVKTMFGEELNITLNELLTNEGIYKMLVGALYEMLYDLFSGILGDQAINLTATWIVDFLTTHIVPLEDLVEFMDDAMPSPDAIFFGEWANDYFPEVEVDLSILFGHILDVISDIVDFVIDLIFFWDVLHLFDAIKDVLHQELMNMFEELFTESPVAELIAGLLADLIRSLGSKLVDEEGSKTGEGVDIDGREPYNFPGPSSDLNIINRSEDGESGITQEQCQALWDQNNPNSLLGMNPLTNPIWFEALAGIEEAKFFIMNTFSLNETQLELILTWIATSINGWLKNICEYSIKDWNSGLLTTRTVKEWLFTAVDNLVNEQDPSEAHVELFSNCSSAAEAEVVDMKSFTVNTGKLDIDQVSNTVKYDGMEVITVWEEREKVRGTDGTQFAPGVSKNDPLYVFITDLLRTVEITYSGTNNIYGIELYRFKLSEETLKINPKYYQSIEGLANMTIDQGIPTFLSKPHFLDASSHLKDSVSGLNPNETLHDIYIDVEPLSGAVMNAGERIQVNFMVNHTDMWYINCWEGIMPILWLEFGGQITENLANKFKNLVYTAQDLSVILYQGCIGVGAALIIPGMIFTTTQNRKRLIMKKQKPAQGKKTSKLPISKNIKHKETSSSSGKLES